MTCGGVGVCVCGRHFDYVYEIGERSLKRVGGWKNVDRV